MSITINEALRSAVKINKTLYINLVMKIAQTINFLETEIYELLAY